MAVKPMTVEKIAAGVGPVVEAVVAAIMKAIVVGTVVTVVAVVTVIALVTVVAVVTVIAMVTVVAVVTVVVVVTVVIVVAVQAVVAVVATMAGMTISMVEKLAAATTQGPVVAATLHEMREDCVSTVLIIVADVVSNQEELAALAQAALVKTLVQIIAMATLTGNVALTI